MSPKAERFCAEYMVDMNATQAAIRAGYSRATARSIGHENLTKPDIRERIAHLKMEQESRTRITADRVLQELAVVAFANIGDFLRWTDTRVELLPRDLIEPSKLGAVDSLAVEDNGRQLCFKLKLRDSLRALEILGRHLGMFAGNAADEPKRPPEEMSKRLSEAINHAMQRIRIRLEKERVAGES